MSEETRRHGLGRGLSALLGDDTKDYASLDRVRSTKEVPIERLHPGKYQPRRRFDSDEIAELASSFGAMTEYLRRMVTAAGRIAAGDLRTKIEPNPDQPSYILTETGVGYRLRAPEG